MTGAGLSTFAEDDEWQRHMRDTVLKPGLYDRLWPGRHVFLDGAGDGCIELQRLGVDTVIAGSRGAVLVEEKIVRWRGEPMDAMCLETSSCSVEGHEHAGWIVTSIADWLLYCFANEKGGLDCYRVPMRHLRHWFTPRAAQFKVFGPLETLNRSIGRIVPIAEILKACPTTTRHACPPP